MVSVHVGSTAAAGKDWGDETSDGRLEWQGKEDLNPVEGTGPLEEKA